MPQKDKITLIGAGLVGSLLGVFLAKRGFSVDIFERRPDLRKSSDYAGRSINLALAQRGIYPLEEVGLADEVKKLMLPMTGRMIHDESGHLQLQSYGQTELEEIYSVSRSLLNALLLDAAEKTENVRIHFNHSCKRVDSGNKVLTVQDTLKNQELKTSYTRLIGTDGSASKVRNFVNSMLNKSANEDPLGHSYKELSMPASNDHDFAMDKKALHIWPRHDFMMIALPNLDASFTVTLFLPNSGEHTFENLDTEPKLKTFFKKFFPDALKLIPNLEKEFFQNPVGKLKTVRCPSWHFEDSVLLMGDAAHAIVPFHGQGMNAGFEDCSVLAKCIDDHYPNWANIMEEFERIRKPSCNAIADLSLENYVEMRSSVRDSKYLLRKELEFKLEKKFPNTFIPRYSMVMFHRIPYDKAKERGLIQSEILHECCQEVDHIDQVDMNKAYELVNKKLVSAKADTCYSL